MRSQKINAQSYWDLKYRIAIKILAMLKFAILFPQIYRGSQHF